MLCVKPLDYPCPISLFVELYFSAKTTPPRFLAMGWCEAFVSLALL